MLERARLPGRLTPFRSPEPTFRRRFCRTPIAAAVSSLLAPAVFHSLPAFAAETSEPPEEVTVTATRREERIQDVPLNITAINGSALIDQGISGLADLGRSVPGLFVVDQGGRSANRIIVRGLNATSVGAAEGVDNDGGGTVATYVGEVPLYVDLKPVDIERVEILMGPQGTLYGAGTLGGAIRYIPRRPSFDAPSLTLRGDTYGLAESDDLGGRGGFTINVPFSETLAFRASAEYLDDPGFIDYNFVVREPGVSNPQPDLSDPAAVDANLRRVKDANDEQTLFGRAALRFRPTDTIDATLSYFYQNMEVGARTIEQRDSFGTGEYESGLRVLEPSERRNQLLALEVTADLGFAELTSATGASRYNENGQRDQTDLLFTLAYSYESFPSFTAFTREDQKDKTFNQELRLVSKAPGPVSWIAGAYYNKLDGHSTSKEFTPGYSEYLVDIGFGEQTRPDNLEYISDGTTEQKEKAVYGEVTWSITDRWSVTGGVRWYKYDLQTQTAIDIPLFSTISGDRGPDDIDLEYEGAGQKDDGTLFKFNTAYDFTDDVMGYLTISEGYRIGNSNGIGLCTAETEGQTICAQPDEVQYFPDKTTNYEIGWRTQWLNRRLTVNGSVFYIKWEDPQLASSTAVGLQPITKNGEGAETRGFDVTLSARPTERFGISTSFSYTKAELTKDAPRLLRTYLPGGFGASNSIDISGIAGDRLPGSPEKQGTLFVNYDLPLANGWALDMNYGLAAIGNVLTRTGARANGETLPGYTLHQAWATLIADQWSVSLYADNLTNKFARTGVRGDTSYLQTLTDENGDARTVRSYYHDVLRPRQIGLRFTYDFSF